MIPDSNMYNKDYRSYRLRSNFNLTKISTFNGHLHGVLPGHLFDGFAQAFGDHLQTCQPSRIARGTSRIIHFSCIHSRSAIIPRIDSFLVATPTSGCYSEGKKFSTESCRTNHFIPLFPWASGQNTEKYIFATEN